MTIDLEKTFDSMNHAFVIAAIKKHGFSDNFIDWIKILLKDKQSCVINDGHTIKRLKKECVKGFQYQHIILFLHWKYFLLSLNKNTHGLKIFDQEYLYTTYMVHKTFFSEEISFIKVVLKDLHLFSRFSGLRPNSTTCEIAGIGALKGVHVALCGMKCLDLTKEYI